MLAEKQLYSVLQNSPFGLFCSRCSCFPLFPSECYFSWNLICHFLILLALSIPSLPLSLILAAKSTDNASCAKTRQIDKLGFPPENSVLAGVLRRRRSRRQQWLPACRWALRWSRSSAKSAITFDSWRM